MSMITSKVVELWEILGPAYGASGSPQKAQKFLEQALPVFEKYYGRDHFIAFLIIVQTGHRKAESTARRKDSNRGMFFLALFFIANQ